MPSGFKINGVDLDYIWVRRELLTEGGVWLTGLNSNGQLGDLTTSNRSAPNQIVIWGTDWQKVSAGEIHSAAIRYDGSLWTWGGNPDGQLGDSSVASKSSPVVISSDDGWKEVSCGGRHTAAIDNAGLLWAWGHNQFGQVGDETTDDQSGPIQITTAINWKQVSAGKYHTVALRTDGTLWSWGHNQFGQLGLGNTTHRSSPVQIAGEWKYVACGNYHTIAVKSDDTLWSWGHNQYGQLGHGNTTHRSSPIQVESSIGWKKIAVGGFHNMAIKADGSLWVWGHNGLGQLGIGNTSHRSSPVQTTAGGKDWKSIACGGHHSAAIKIDHSLWTWGNNTVGQLMTGTTTSRSSPAQISETSNWRDVSCGENHTITIIEDKTGPGFISNASPVIPGSITLSTPGTYEFVVPNYNSLEVELWGGGGGSASLGPDAKHGASGGAATWDGGSSNGKPQANGGQGGRRGVEVNDLGSDSSGGTAVNGDINSSGGNGKKGAASKAGNSGGSPNGGAGRTGRSTVGSGSNGNAPGGGGTGPRCITWYGSWVGGTTLGYPAGAGGAYCKKTYAPGAYSVGQVVVVVVPSGGAGINYKPNMSNTTYSGGDGANGRVKITWN
jgi:alpha-tubulin suppressor-like RCC1 family protein